MLNTVCVLGGTGFIGTWLVNELNDRGCRIIVPTRDREQARTLWMLPRVELVSADVHDPATLDRLFTGVDVVFNLVGILNEAGDDGEGFRYAHQELSRKVIEAARQQGVHRLLHMSALNADPDAPSHYLKTKGIAENRVLNADEPNLRTAVFRPSVVFGPGDGMFCRFDKMLGLTPGVMLLPCADARFAPVYVGDVVAAMLHALDDPKLKASRYELCGSDEMTLLDMVHLINQVRGRRRLILPLGPGLSAPLARLLEFLPGQPMSRDNFRSTQVASVCNPDSKGVVRLADLGITPQRVIDVLPEILGMPRQQRRFTRARQHARRA